MPYTRRSQRMATFVSDARLRTDAFTTIAISWFDASEVHIARKFLADAALGHLGRETVLTAAFTTYGLRSPTPEMGSWPRCRGSWNT